MKSIATTLCLDCCYLGDFLGQKSIQPPLKRMVLETHSFSPRKYAETSITCLYACQMDFMHGQFINLSIPGANQY